MKNHIADAYAKVEVVKTRAKKYAEGAGHGSTYPAQVGALEVTLADAYMTISDLEDKVVRLEARMNNLTRDK